MPGDQIGFTGICKLYIKEDKSGQYQPKNAVADYMTDKPKVKSEPAKADVPFDDDVPF